VIFIETIGWLRKEESQIHLFSRFNTVSTGIYVRHKIARSEFFCFEMNASTAQQHDVRIASPTMNKYIQ
jgi:hypothetical protein